MKKSSKHGVVKRGISYDRVSTLGQVQNNDGSYRQDASPESQRRRCIDFVGYVFSQKGTKFEFLKHLSDEGFSGKDVNRPGYQEMLELITTKSIDFIVATELSRLSRNVLDFLELVKLCEENDVDIFLIGLNLDTSSPFGKVMVIILVALAQFEREMTGMRVKENALSRLLNDGRINGASEILGLVKDPDRKGHFIKDEEGILILEKVLKLFLKFSSKKKVLQAAKELGLTGKDGKQLTLHALDIILENTKWRYKGLWYANKENEGLDQDSLPDSRKYQVVKLPHGPVVDEKLLDSVQGKLQDTHLKKKKSTKGNYAYLFSHTMYYEDGSNFSGQPAKDKQYRYYHNRKNNIRIRCEQIEELVIGEVKESFKNDERFHKMVERATKKRQTELPKVEAEIKAVEKTIVELNEMNGELRKQLADRNQVRKPGFMDWLADQVGAVADDLEREQSKLDILRNVRMEILQESGLNDLQKQVRKLLSRFDSLNRVEQRSVLERVVKRILVKKDNKIRLEFHPELMSPGRAVTLRNKSTEREENGGVDGT